MSQYVQVIFGAILFVSNIVPYYCNRCGYESCPTPRPGVVNIHLVPHTHDDVGWLKTRDQYYYGQNMSIQEAGVQYIIDSVIDALVENPERRFIYVETAYFWMWWQEQTPEKQQLVKNLVNSGRLEIIGGAWSMNDEAAAHYHSIIDQFTWGFRRLNESLGECATPKIGWQIDPFGHSRENAAIMAKMGFHGLFLGRIDFEDKINRKASKTMEMIWHTSENDMSDAAELFTCVMYNTYSAPSGFCFDVHCQDSPIIDNVKSPEYNVPERVESFLRYMSEYSKAYRSSNVIVTMGEDFNYQYAGMNFKNMDKLIKYINQEEAGGSKFHAFYSTPSCYLKAVHDEGIQLPTKSDDFFPYASDPQSFWTGYFTSRPTQKRFERMGNNYLQVGKQISALSNLPASIDISEAKETMGVMQHHDAITGTEKQKVASDYARLLTNAFKTLDKASSIGLNNLVNKVSAPTKKLEFNSCLLLNISSCPQTERASSFVVTVYNPLSRLVNKLVRLPVANSQLNYIVRGPDESDIPVQLVPLPPFFKLPGRVSDAKFDIVFIAKNIPPLGFKSFYVETSQVMQAKFHLSEEVKVKESLKLGYENSVTVSISSKGQIMSMKTKNSFVDVDVPLKQNFFYYRGAVGNNELSKGGERSSGAYIFRPNGTEIPINLKPITRIVRGPLITEIQQKFNDWVSQVIRIQTGVNHIEFQWCVGPIPFEDGKGDNFGKEVITRYTIPSLHNNGVFYTDSNGREMIRRKLNYRPTWKVVLVEPISGNYYPVTTRINIQDTENEALRLSVITDRSEGGTSLNDGQIELMLHRRLLHDDAFGVNETLNEEAFGEPLVALGSHYVTTDHSSKARMLTQEKVLDSWIFISPTQGLSYNQWKTTFNMKFSGLRKGLPDNVQILTLEPWLEAEDNKKVFILRLENIMEKSDDPTPTEVDIKDLFTTFSIVNIKEMMLGANIPVQTSLKIDWNRLGTMYRKYNKKLRETFQSSIFVLEPMEIRTLLIEIEPLSNLYNRYSYGQHEAIML